MTDATQVRKVLVALDGSPAAATALPVARALAAQLGAAIEILHVTPRQPLAPELWQQLHAGLLDAECVQIRSRAGSPAEAILEAAADPAVMLVVLTTHGRTVERGRRLSHVAEAVAARTDRPILLVRPEAGAVNGRPPGPLRRLLMPLDGTPTTAAALAPATELASCLCATIDLLYVVKPDGTLPTERGSIGAPRYVDQPQHEWPGWTAECVERLGSYLARCPAGVAVRMYLGRGAIADEIRRFAVEHEDDAIVLVSRSRLEPGRAQILRAVLDSTPCPVLLVSAPAEARPQASDRE